MTEYDRRVTPARHDMAAVHLKGIVDVPAYRQGNLKMIAYPYSDVFSEPDVAGGLETQLLYGEPFMVYEEKDGWCWGQSLLDEYVGYVRGTDLEQFEAHATHRVSHTRTYVYPEPCMKSAPVSLLSLNSRLHVERDAEDGFVEATAGGFVIKKHLTPLIQPASDDPSKWAEMMLSTPYLWGGRTTIGLDCSALVQMCLMACNIACPRDSDLQEATVGFRISPSEPLQRNDLIFWKGHVGMMVDGEHIIHANAHHMSVTKEPLAVVDGRNKDPIRSIKRLRAV
jgi:cell wall-associated NlpC family hydrolase